MGRSRFNKRLREKVEDMMQVSSLHNRMRAKDTSTPSEARAMFNTTIIRHLVWEDVYPSQPSPNLGELASTVSEFNCPDLLQSLSMLNVIFFQICQDVPNSSLDWMHEYLEPDAFERAMDCRNKTGAVFPYGPAIVLLQRIAFEHARDLGGEFVANRPIEFGKMLLAATVHAGGQRFREALASGASERDRRDALVGHLFREYAFSPLGNVWRQIARYWAMLVLYPDVVRKRWPDQFYDSHQFFESEI